MKTSRPDGVIRFEFDNISTLDWDGRDSPEIEVRGVAWCANVCRSDGLCVYLHCKSNQSTQSRIDVDSELILFNSDTSKNIIKERSDIIRNEDDEYRGDKFLKWEKLIDEEKGFIKDDKITVEIRFWIYNMRGVMIAPRFDFTDPNEPFHDVALVINGEKIFVNKGILAANSAVFKAMFYGEFVERDKKEIEMKDIDREEFIELLYVIYPSSKKITDYSAEFLLKLADRFQMTTVTNRVEEYLIASGDEFTMENMIIADKYRLFGLLMHCLSDLRATKDFEDIKKSPIYNSLSSDTKAVLFERLLKIVTGS